ncbi:hypothetical protein [Nocardia brevicatena]|uniref:hypothetical protein n=1 Tax=Nocardia brevicatena TaxID=37327 RepID=UPI000593132A|nr:hypothetical protein [Nocardia brevicatena]
MDTETGPVMGSWKFVTRDRPRDMDRPAWWIERFVAIFAVVAYAGTMYLLAGFDSPVGYALAAVPACVLGLPTRYAGYRARHRARRWRRCGAVKDRGRYPPY